MQYNMAQRAMYNGLGTLGTHRVILRHKLDVPEKTVNLSISTWPVKKTDTWHT